MLAFPLRTSMDGYLIEILDSEEQSLEFDKLFNVLIVDIGILNLTLMS